MRPVCKITIERYSPVPPGHLADPNGPPDGRLIVDVVAREPLLDLRLAVPCWTVASVPAPGVSPPVIVPQFRPTVYALGMHGAGRNARMSLVNQGFEPVELLRADGTRVGHRRPYQPSDWRGINIHSRLGNVSNGCPTVLEKDMTAVVRLCQFVNDLPMPGVSRHRDGRLLFDFELIDRSKETIVHALPRR